ncbi:MAG: enoyl-CoA hydratase [Novosphingobium sp.]|nr:enoyl-CoA hydratase [Novosphingobium sp.]
MTVLLEQADGVAKLTLNRPGTLNALTVPMLDQLVETLQALATDGKVRCVLLTGAGRGFCAGYDLSGTDVPEHMRDPLPEESAAHMMIHSQIPSLLRRMPKPTIAAIRGPAAGSGLLLAAACDLRLASTTARFKLAFASAGRCGDPGGSFLLTQLVGSGKARELYLLDEKFDADAALAMGLVNRVIADESLDAEAEAMACKLAQGPTAAFAAMKRNLNNAETSSFEETMALEATANAQLSKSHDGQEAARAFMEKRPPQFRGY